MKPFLTLALICMGAAACQTQNRHARLSVDDDALVRVPVSDRDDINKARTECMESEDRVAVAEHDLENAKERLALAERTAAASKDEVEAAHERCKLADKTKSESRELEMKEAATHCESVCAHARWADAQVVYHKHLVKEAEGRVEIEKARADLAKAEVELAKAKAVNDADKNDLDPYDIAAFENEVATRKLEVEMAEIDREAWERKMKLCRERVDEQGKSVPASYRVAAKDPDDKKKDDFPPK